MFERWNKLSKEFIVPSEVAGETVKNDIGFLDVYEYSKDIQKFIHNIQFKPGDRYRIRFEKLGEGEGTNLYM